jgi:hypothetical protein
MNVIDALVEENEVIQINTQGSVDGNVLEISWADGLGCPDASSIVVKVYSFDTTTRQGKVWTEGYAKCERGDGFVPLASNASVTVNLTAGDHMVRVRNLYAPATIIAQGVSGYSLPAQSYKITSRASQQETGETKVIELDRSYEAFPSIFDYAIFSGTTLVM